MCPSRSRQSGRPGSSPPRILHSSSPGVDDEPDIDALARGPVLLARQNREPPRKHAEPSRILIPHDHVSTWRRGDGGIELGTVPTPRHHSREMFLPILRPVGTDPLRIYVSISGTVIEPRDHDLAFAG